MNLKDIFVNIKAKFDDKEVKKGKSSVDGLSKALTGLAAAYTIKKGVGFVSNLASQVDVLEKQARAVKMSTVELQAFRFAAGLSGVQGNQFVRTLGMLQKKSVDMSQGLEQATKNFALVGLSMEDLLDSGGKMVGVEEIFLRVADGFSKLEATAQTGTAMKIFGEQGQALVPMLSEGRAGIEAMMNEAKSLGYVFDEQAAKAAANFRDANTRLEGSLVSLKNVIVVPLMKGMSDIILKISGFVTKLRDAFAGVDMLNVGIMIMLVPAVMALVAALNLLLAHPWYMALMAAIFVIDDLTVAFNGGQSAVREFFLEFFNFDIVDVLDGITKSAIILLDVLTRLYKVQSAIWKLAKSPFEALGDMAGVLTGQDSLASANKKSGDRLSEVGDLFSSAFGSGEASPLAAKLQAAMEERQAKRAETQLASQTPLSAPGRDFSGVDFADLHSKRARSTAVQRDKNSSEYDRNEAALQAQDAAAGRTVNLTINNPSDAQSNRYTREVLATEANGMSSY